VTIEEALRLAVAQAARGTVTLPADLHGFPGTAHGGAVAAVFHRLALPRPPVELRLEIARGVPVDTPLPLETASTGATAQLALSLEGRTLATATLRRDGIAAPDPGRLLAAWAGTGGQSVELPGTATCLACGRANPVGLAARFRAAPDVLGLEYAPRAAYRTREGDAHPALALILLDELGWWLGALAQRECGVTTDVRLTLFARIPFAPLLVLGDRAGVRTDDDPRGRYARATGLLLGPEREVLAAADVRFAGSRAYTRRLLEPFLETTPLETVERWFPSARELAARRERS
jgi:hypothetical protein